MASKTSTFKDRVSSPVAQDVAEDVAEARAGWKRRALLVGGAFQVVFGALWLARGLAPLAPFPVAAGAAVAALIAGIVATAALRRSAPRPAGEAARAIERRLTLATVLQLVASFVLPFVIGAALGPRLVTPSVLLTIGVLLAWLHREVDTPYQGGAGWALIGLAGVSALFTGEVQTALAGLTAAAILFGCAAAGFGWLHRQRGA